MIISCDSNSFISFALEFLSSQDSKDTAASTSASGDSLIHETGISEVR